MRRIPGSIFILSTLFAAFQVACSGVGGGGSDLTTIDLGPQEDTILSDQGQDTTVPPDVPLVDGVVIDLPHVPDVPDAGQDLVTDLPVDANQPDPSPEDPGFIDPGQPDVDPIADPIFRTSELEVMKPTFCLDMGVGAECADVTKTVNAYIAASIANVDDPMNLLFRLTPFVLQDPSVNLIVGNGTCQFTDGKPAGCTFFGGEDPFLFEGPLFVDCGPDLTGHCFETSHMKIEMMFMGIFLALHDAVLSGRVDGAGLEIKDGQIDGFVPVNTTKSIQVTLPGGSSYLLHDFLKHTPPDDLKGVKGYWFEFEFGAQGVEHL